MEETRVKINKLQPGINSKIIGKVNIQIQTNKNDEEYLLIFLNDGDGTIAFPVWQNCNFYKDVEKLKDGDFASFYGQLEVVKKDNKEYRNFIPNKFEPIEVKELKHPIKDLKLELKKQINLIENAFLKSVLIQALNNPTVLNNMFKAPSTLMSAYNYEGGLLHQIIDTVEIISKLELNKVLENSFEKEIISINYDLLKVAAILSILGKTYTLEFDDNKEIIKTVDGELASDIVYARDITVLAINNVKQANLKGIQEQIEDKNTQITAFNNYLNSIKDLEVELLHTISAAKGPIQFGSIAVGRSKHAMLLADINNIVYTRFIFAHLEQEQKILGNKFGELYNNGKKYKL